MANSKPDAIKKIDQFLLDNKLKDVKYEELDKEGNKTDKFIISNLKSIDNPSCELPFCHSVGIHSGTLDRHFCCRFLLNDTFFVIFGQKTHFKLFIRNLS